IHDCHMEGASRADIPAGIRCSARDQIVPEGQDAPYGWHTSYGRRSAIIGRGDTEGGAGAGAFDRGIDRATGDDRRYGVHVGDIRLAGTDEANDVRGGQGDHGGAAARDGAGGGALTNSHAAASVAE